MCVDEVSGMHVVPAGCGGKINSARNSQITKHLQGTGVHEDKKKRSSKGSIYLIQNGLQLELTRVTVAVR